MILVHLFMKYEVLGILFCIFTAYSIVNHLNVNFSHLIIWIRKESFDFSAIHYPNYVVSFRRGFDFLLMLG